MLEHDTNALDTDRDFLSRRQFAQAALASAGLFVAGSALAQPQPSLGVTAESPMGPFYPLHPLAENDADLTRLAGHRNRARGTVIELTGRIRDVRGNPIMHFVLTLMCGIVTAFVVLLHGWLHRFTHGIPMPIGTMLWSAAYSALLAPFILVPLNRLRRLFAFEPPRRRMRMA